MPGSECGSAARWWSDTEAGQSCAGHTIWSAEPNGWMIMKSRGNIRSNRVRGDRVESRSFGI